MLLGFLADSAPEFVVYSGLCVLVSEAFESFAAEMVQLCARRQRKNEISYFISSREFVGIRIDTPFLYTNGTPKLHQGYTDIGGGIFFEICRADSVHQLHHKNRCATRDPFWVSGT